jgi:hypothetical protein
MPVADYQVFWNGRLEDLQPLTIPYVKQVVSPNQQYISLVKSVPDRYIKHNFILRGSNNLWAVLKDPRLELKDKLSFTLDIGEQLYKQVAHKLEIIIYKSNQKRPLPYKIRRSRVFDAGVEALSHYTPPVYRGGKVLLIRANDNPEHINHNYQLGWDKFLTDELEVCEISADQTTLLFEPHIRSLAVKLNSCLARIHHR